MIELKIGPSDQKPKPVKLFHLEQVDNEIYLVDEEGVIILSLYVEKDKGIQILLMSDLSDDKRYSTNALGEIIVCRDSKSKPYELIPINPNTPTKRKPMGKKS